MFQPFINLSAILKITVSRIILSKKLLGPSEKQRVMLHRISWTWPIDTYRRARALTHRHERHETARDTQLKSGGYNVRRNTCTRWLVRIRTSVPENAIGFVCREHSPFRCRAIASLCRCVRAPSCLCVCACACMQAAAAAIGRDKRARNQLA